MPDIDISAIERFVSLVKYTSQQNAGHPTGNIMVRLPLQEAMAVTSEIAAVMTRLAMAKHGNEETHFTAAADGGSLR